MSRDITLSLALSTVTFLLVLIWGSPLIEVLRRLHVGKQIRVDGPQTHIVKTGTPTMGGIMIVAPVLAINALMNVVNLVRGTSAGRSILLPLGVLTFFAALGAWDDWLGLSGKRRGEGLRGTWIILLQTVIAFVTACGLYFVLDIHSLVLPAVPFKVDLGLLYIPVAMFIIVGSSNAFNISDGLDSLCGLVAAAAFVAYSVIAFLQGQVHLVRFSLTMVGAVLAFLWYNAHPAELFMGGSGSYALGAALGVVALMTGQWLLFPIIIIVPASVTMSVMLQVIYFKLTRRLTGQGKRLFKMAPLHHHFEMVGWSETQVVQRFALVAFLGAVIGIALALL
jgi:phospho-N-acetylmuramoyl-pentapeptide-transferase